MDEKPNEISYLEMCFLRDAPIQEQFHAVVVGLMEDELDEVVVGPRVSGLFGQNHIMFMKVALALNQGLNLRNRLAHGLLLPEEFTLAAADVVFQCLLIPGLVKLNATPSSEN